MLPTFNERENLPLLLQMLFQKYPQAQAVVVDDNSPDGTGQIAQKLKREVFQDRLIVIQRQARGRGSAGVVGFRRALRTGLPLIIEMDADLSHQPEEIELLLQGLQKFELVIGSRLISGARDERGWKRRALTRCSNLYLSRVLQMPSWDMTSGFRGYRSEVLRAVLSHNPFSKGPPIVVEILYLAFKEGFYVGEVPISFRERRKGKSKLNKKILWQSLYSPFLFKHRHG